MAIAASGEVLLALEDAAVAQLLQGTLEREGFAVRIAQTADEALSAVGGGEVPVVVADVGLPGKSGFDLVRALRLRDANAEVILLASSDDPRLPVIALRAGAADYVVKRWEGADSLVQSIRAAQARRVVSRGRAQTVLTIAGLTEELSRDLSELDRALAGLTVEGDDDTADVCKVLLVDDEPSTVTALGGLLSNAGYHIESALSAEDALPRLLAGHFNILVTDKNLPEMSGVELIRRLHEKQPEVAAVLMTGYGSMTSAIEALDVGASAYLLKPFEDLDEVLLKINNVRARMEARRRREHAREAYWARARAFLEQAAAWRKTLSESSSS